MEQSTKHWRREDWGALTPFSRNFLRAEYKHLLKSDVHPIIARGCINRIAGMFGLVKAGA